MERKWKKTLNYMERESTIAYRNALKAGSAFDSLKKKQKKH